MAAASRRSLRAKAGRHRTRLTGRLIRLSISEWKLANECRVLRHLTHYVTAQSMNENSSNIVARVGMALYRSEDWARPLAHFLGLETRTMQRIALAARERRPYPVRSEWLPILRDTLRNQAAHYDGLADEIDMLISTQSKTKETPIMALPEILKAAGGYVLLERGLPHGILKSDLFSAREKSGRRMEFRGQFTGAPTITREMVDGWVREGRLKAEDSSEDASVLYRPTG
jgi:hypothetical protein